jgi:hypothetical protein
VSLLLLLVVVVSTQGQPISVAMLKSHGAFVSSPPHPPNDLQTPPSPFLFFCPTRSRLTFPAALLRQQPSWSVLQNNYNIVFDRTYESNSGTFSEAHLKALPKMDAVVLSNANGNLQSWDQVEVDALRAWLVDPAGPKVLFGSYAAIGKDVLTASLFGVNTSSVDNARPCSLVDFDVFPPQDAVLKGLPVLLSNVYLNTNAMSTRNPPDGSWGASNLLPGACIVGGKRDPTKNYDLKQVLIRFDDPTGGFTAFAANGLIETATSNDSLMLLDRLLRFNISNHGRGGSLGGYCFPEEPQITTGTTGASTGTTGVSTGFSTGMSTGVSATASSGSTGIQTAGTTTSPRTPAVLRESSASRGGTQFSVGLIIGVSVGAVVVLLCFVATVAVVLKKKRAGHGDVSFGDEPAVPLATPASPTSPELLAQYQQIDLAAPPAESDVGAYHNVTTQQYHNLTDL